MNTKFNLLNKTYKLIEYYEKLLINYSKKEVVLKQNVEKCYYELIENLFAFNINDTDRIKQKYLKEYLIKLSMLDFYTNISFIKKLISKRQFEVIGRKIIEIQEPTYQAIYREEKEVKEMTIAEIEKELGYPIKVVEEEE